jgi:L-alanine-DL-glutamate epimerase-like enolase superfamily enzyme
MLELGALSTLIMDLSWCGGISEARKAAAMAEAFAVPVAFHDCTGPVVLAASTHLALHARNCAIQEMVRAFYYGWYGPLVTALPPVAGGMITVPEGAGLGLSLVPDVLRREDAAVRVSRA